jgi:hypothetical protein
MAAGPGMAQYAQHVHMAGHQIAARGRVLITAALLLIPAPGSSVVVVPRVVALVLPPLAAVPMIIVVSRLWLMFGGWLPMLLLLLMVLVGPVITLLETVSLLLYSGTSLIRSSMSIHCAV